MRNGLWWRYAPMCRRWLIVPLSRFPSSPHRSWPGLFTHSVFAEHLYLYLYCRVPLFPGSHCARPFHMFQSVCQQYALEISVCVSVCVFFLSVRLCVCMFVCVHIYVAVFLCACLCILGVYECLSRSVKYSWTSDQTAHACFSVAQSIERHPSVGLWQMALLVKDIPNVDSLLFKSVANLRVKSTHNVLMKHPIT